MIVTYPRTAFFQILNILASSSPIWIHQPHQRGRQELLQQSDRRSTGEGHPTFGHHPPL